MRFMGRHAANTGPGRRRRFLRVRQVAVAIGSIVGAFAVLTYLDPAYTWNVILRLAVLVAVDAILMVALNWLLRAGIHMWYAE